MVKSTNENVIANLLKSKTIQFDYLAMAAVRAAVEVAVLEERQACADFVSLWDNELSIGLLKERQTEE